MSAQRKQRFKEIDVERINIVEKNGKVRMVISNEEHFPDPVIDGKTYKRRGVRLPGMIFYNDEGDECGGLIFGSFKGREGQGAGAALLFDQYKQDQIVGIMYQEFNGQRSYGLKVWERPSASFAKKEGGVEGNPKVFVGRNEAGEAIVTLADRQGRERIRIKVDSYDVPRIEFLDENGRVVFSLPPAS